MTDFVIFGNLVCTFLLWYGLKRLYVSVAERDAQLSKKILEIQYYESESRGRMNELRDLRKTVYELKMSNQRLRTKVASLRDDMLKASIFVKGE